MSFQIVRGAFESEAFKALTVDAGLDPANVFFDNFGETPPASGVYATVNFSFSTPVVDTVSCEGLENLQGSLSVNVYTPKNQGSKAGEDACLALMRNWQAINRWKPEPDDVLRRACTREIEGPFTIAPDSRPHHVNNVSCTWMARVGELTTTSVLTTRQVQLTHPTRSVRDGNANTDQVVLTHPVSGLKTQEDANQHFAERIEALEAGGGGTGGTDPNVIKRIEQLEGTHDDHQGHDFGVFYP